MTQRNPTSLSDLDELIQLRQPKHIFGDCVCRIDLIPDLLALGPALFHILGPPEVVEEALHGGLEAAMRVLCRLVEIWPPRWLRDPLIRLDPCYVL